MIQCKNCGEEIQKVIDRWYHKKSQRWFCSVYKAEPLIDTSQIAEEAKR